MRRLSSAALLAIALILPLATQAGETVRIATYNVENYLDRAAGGRPAKSPESRAKVREAIHSLNPDVLALQEMGSTNALLELRETLKSEGLDFPHWDHVAGWDTNIHVALLSKYPIVARRPHTRESYLLSGRRFQVSRGFAEVDIAVNPSYTFTLISAHLKSRRPVPEGDESLMREEEAKLLREIVDSRLAANAKANLVVLGDLNDLQDSKPVRTLIGRGSSALVDTRPAERNGDNLPNPNPRYAPRNITWTHYYGKEDSYSRIDYILLSPGMAREWRANDTYLLTLPNWGQASDHRPILVTVTASDL